MLKNIKSMILSIIATIALCVMLCSTFFVQYAMYDNYFLLFPMSVGVSLVSIVALFSFFVREGNFRLSLPDILISILVIYYAARYDYQLQLANWKIVYAVLLLILWFATRILISYIHISRDILLGGIVGIGCMLTVWGLLQLYNCVDSNHRIFAITGPFYNPGPYSGYIAMIFPISLCRLLKSKGAARYFWLISFSLMLCILPAGMSRSAWLALFVSSIWLLAIHYRLVNKLIFFTKARPRVAMGCFLSLLCTLLLILFALFYMKADSANGRLFIWENTCKAISAHPLVGYGIGTFSHVYGSVQSEHFASGNYTDLEERVAGSPEYAFNEYLQMCVEGGLLLLLFFLAISIWIIIRGINNEEYGACAGLISLFVFSFSSYPFQILPFMMVGVILSTICITNKKSDVNIHSTYTFIYSVIIMLSALLSSYLLQKSKDISQRWFYIDVLHREGSFKEATIGYERIYKYLNHNPNFLVKYARVLIAQEEYDKAIKVLERAKLICCYPIVWNLQGKCYQLAHDYISAEKCFKESIDLLPGRIYPYYLLAKLYSESSFYHDVEMKKMANIVLSKNPKIPSKAIDEMRVEMSLLINKFSN